MKYYSSRLFLNIENTGPITDGLVFYIDPTNPLCFDGTGDFIYDLSSYNTPIVSHVSGITENEKNYFYFDGSQGRVIAANPSSIFDTINTITIESMIKSYDIYSDRHIASKGYGYQYRFRVEFGGSIWLYDINGGTLSSPEGLITENEWYYVAASMGPDGRKLYVNGDMVAENYIPYTPQSKFADTTGHFVGLNNDFSEVWYGEIGISTRYNRVLTNEEIIQNYNNYKKSYNI